MAEGPFPEHYEPFETPIGVNPLHRDNRKAISNPAARVFKNDMELFGTADEFPTRRPPTGSPSTSTTGPSTAG